MGISRQKGFTFLEIIVVLLFISVMSLLGYTAWKTYTSRLDAATVEGQIRRIIAELDNQSDVCTPGFPPSTAPQQTPWGQPYEIDCLREGYTITANLPEDILPFILSKFSDTTLSGNTLTVSVVKPYIEEGDEN